MPSRKLETPLRIELAPSWRLLILLLVIHGGAALLATYFEIPLTLKALLLVALAFSAIVSMHKTGWLNTAWLRSRMPLRWQHIPTLIWQADGDWLLSTRSGNDVLARLLPTSTCQPFFVALNFRVQDASLFNRYVSVVIFADAVDAEIFRQLRVRLRTRFVQETNSLGDTK